MIRCPHCNAEIKYIYSNNEIIPVNPKEKSLFNNRGRVLKGYELHECKKINTLPAVDKE